MRIFLQLGGYEQFPKRSHQCTMDKMLRKTPGVEFLRLAGEIERCRGSLEPLHIPFGKRVTPFSKAENRTLADLFFSLPDPTDAAFFKQALFLLVSPRLASLLTASPPNQTDADLARPASVSRS